MEAHEAKESPPPSPIGSEGGDSKYEGAMGDVPRRPRGFSLPADPNLVDWDGEDDPSNPRNWSFGRKVREIVPIIWITFLTPLASSMFAPGITQVLKEFRVREKELATFVVSVYIIGFAVGPVLISPLSELYGRRIVYNVCNVLFIIFTIACAVAQSMPQLIVFRLLAGMAGVCPVTIGGASIADMVDQEKRGIVVTLYVMGDLMGPVIGPIGGGFLAAAASWRWTFWVIAIAYGIGTIAMFFMCSETYAPVLLARKTHKLRRASGNASLRSAKDTGHSRTQHLLLAWARPVRMLFLSPIAGCMALYVAIEYAFLYLLYTTFTFVFEEHYHIKPSHVGLVYLGAGIGLFIGLFVIGATSDKLLKRQAAKSASGKLKPEFRLIPLMFLGFLMPVGLFIYGWTVQYHINFYVPLLGTLIFGVGVITVLICTQVSDGDFRLHTRIILPSESFSLIFISAIFDRRFPSLRSLRPGRQLHSPFHLGWRLTSWRSQIVHRHRSRMGQLIAGFHLSGPPSHPVGLLHLCGQAPRKIQGLKRLMEEALLGKI